LLWSPPATWRAFAKGRGERSLYRPELREAAEQLSLDALMNRTRARGQSSRLSDAAAFAWLVLQSALVIAAPIAVIAIALID
jgi:hypothetical protein